jgi:peptidoglycan hydrolase CwlO-like protein
MTLTCPNTTSIKFLITTTLFAAVALVSLSLLAPAEGKSCKDIDSKDDQLECYADKEKETLEKLDKTKDKITETQEQITNLSGQLNVTQSELNQVQNSINEIGAELELVKENLADRQEKLSDKIDFRNSVLRNYSKQTVMNDLEMFFYPLDSRGSEAGSGDSGAGPGASQADGGKTLSGFQFSAFTYIFNKTINDKSLEIIGVLNNEIKGFEKNKKEAEELKAEMESAQDNLISLKSDLANKKLSAEEEEEELSEKKSDYEEELEELQGKILELKSGGGNGTVGDYEAVAAKTPDPPFKPAFAAFSYGAYTHYKGMSQYGARGRAENGKDYKDIIEFYYKTSVKEKDLPNELCVEGYGNMDFQKYLYGLGEMPSSWPEDALKAQAVAARSYAYRYIKAGKCICTTQSCQVFVKSKSDDPPSRWKDAVDDTKDKILDSEDTVAYYSSTTGGYIENVGWDTKCGDSGCWPGDAYEKEGGSPWFRKAWYIKSYNDGSTCGRPHPWLSEEEMADIANSWVVWKKGSSSEQSHITPVTTDCWGGDPYSYDKMREKADDRGDAYSKVTSVKVDVSNSGYTSQVHLTTDKGTISIDGAEFKTVFNLRAPGYVAIRNRLFDFERED